MLVIGDGSRDDGHRMIIMVMTMMMMMIVMMIMMMMMTIVSACCEAPSRTCTATHKHKQQMHAAKYQQQRILSNAGFVELLVLLFRKAPEHI